MSNFLYSCFISKDTLFNPHPLSYQMKTLPSMFYEHLSSIYPQLDPRQEHVSDVLVNRRRYERAEVFYKCDKTCSFSTNFLMDLYLEKPLPALISNQEKQTARIFYDEKAKQFNAQSAGSINEQTARILDSLSLPFSAEETRKSRCTSGGHNFLRTIADKTQMKAWNAVHFPSLVCDIGSKFMATAKLL